MVMPLYDDNPFRTRVRPVVTWSLIVVTLLVFLAELASRDWQLMAVVFGLIPGALIGDISIPGAPPPALTLVTYLFLHADPAHFFGNMIFLWVFGDNIEGALGRWRFLLFYLLCGAAAALAFVATDPHAQTPLIGASGAVAGIVVAYLMLRPCAKIIVLLVAIPLRISAYWVVGAFALLQVISLGSASQSEVAYWSHIGGMIAGAVLFPIMRRPGVRLFDCIGSRRAEPALAAAESARPPAGDGAR